MHDKKGQSLLCRLAAYWSNEKLQGVTNHDSKAYLDFYQIHYYSTLLAHDSYNPSKVARSVFSSKPVLVGEVGVRNLSQAVL